MMALTADNQLDPRLAEERNKYESIDLDQKKEERKDYPEYVPSAEADVWKSGKAYQATMEEVEFKRKQ